MDGHVGRDFDTGRIVATITRRGAAIAVVRIAIVAGFLGFQKAVPAHIRDQGHLRLRQTHADGTPQSCGTLGICATGGAGAARTNGARTLGCMAARLTERLHAGSCALVLFDEVCIVTRFSGLHDAIATRERTEETIALGTAQTGTTLASVGTRLARTRLAEARLALGRRNARMVDGEEAARGATIGIVAICIIADFARFRDGITADRKGLTTVAVDAEADNALEAVAAFDTFFSEAQKTVGTFEILQASNTASGRAHVDIDVVAIVALFRRVVDDAVAADTRNGADAILRTCLVIGADCSRTTANDAMVRALIAIVAVAVVASFTKIQTPVAAHRATHSPLFVTIACQIIRTRPFAPVGAEIVLNRIAVIALLVIVDRTVAAGLTAHLAILIATTCVAVGILRTRRLACIAACVDIIDIPVVAALPRLVHFAVAAHGRQTQTSLYVTRSGAIGIGLAPQTTIIGTPTNDGRGWIASVTLLTEFGLVYAIAASRTIRTHTWGETALIGTCVAVIQVAVVALFAEREINDLVAACTGAYAVFWARITRRAFLSWRALEQTSIPAVDRADGAHLIVLPRQISYKRER